MPYAYPECSDYMCLLQYSNTVTNDLFGAGILMLIFLTSFIFLKGYGTAKAFSTASWITMIFGIFLGIAGMIGAWVTLLTVILAFVGFLLLIPEIR